MNCAIDDRTRSQRSDRPRPDFSLRVGRPTDVRRLLTKREADHNRNRRGDRGSRKPKGAGVDPRT